MEKTIAVVIDTNFIIQYKNLHINEVIAKLENDYAVYISQVSINERIAQTCRELKTTFDDLNRIVKKSARFAKIEFLKTYDEECVNYKNAMQKNYDKLFQNRIIPFDSSKKTFEQIIERANKKLPPFSDAKDASDKGFKDCLLWFSIMNFFKSNGENEIYFITNDKSAFIGKTDYLCQEFYEETGKTIEFKQNSFYNDYLSAKKESIDVEKTDCLINTNTIKKLRDDIDSVMYNICNVDCEDNYGNEYSERRFTTNVLFDKHYIEIIFYNLKTFIESNIFNKNICASELLDLDDRVINDEYYIPISNLEEALKIYEEVKIKCPEYLEQLFETTARIMNKNYIETSEPDEEELPF